MDNLKPEYRIKNMRNIRSANTKMEILVRSELHKKGYRFRKNVLSMIGKPDIVFTKFKVVVFLDSCFWHMCPYHYNIPKSNQEYWLPKLQRNKLRAKEVNKKLKQEGWMVIRLWEHQINNDLKKSVGKIVSYLV